MSNDTATIVDFSAYRERRASATAPLELWGTEAMANCAFMIIPVSVPMFWYHVWVSSLFPCRNGAQ